MLTRLGRGDESQKYLEAVVEQDPLYRPAVFQLLDLYQKQQNWLGAAKLLDPLVAKDPLDLEMQRRQGYFYLRAGEAAKAEQIMTSILAVDPEDRGARFFRAEALTDLKRPDEAEAIYRKLLEETPDDPEVILSYGLNQLNQDNLEGAAAQFHHLLDLKTVPPGVQVMARTQLASIDYQRKDEPAALAMARTAALDAERPNFQAVSIALEVLKNQEKFDEALSFLDRLDKKFPANPVFEARRVEFLLRTNQEKKAHLIAAREAAKGVEHAVTMSQAYAATDRFSGAVDLLENAGRTIRTILICCSSWVRCTNAPAGSTLRRPRSSLCCRRVRSTLPHSTISATCGPTAARSSTRHWR